MDKNLKLTIDENKNNGGRKMNLKLNDRKKVKDSTFKSETKIWK